MDFEIKPNDVVVVRNDRNEESFRHVVRITKTQIITESFSPDYDFRYSRQDGEKIGYCSRFSRRDCIVRLATPEEAQAHIAAVMLARKDIADQRAAAALFIGFSLFRGPYSADGAWQVGVEFKGLTEGQLAELAAALKPFAKTE